VVLETAEQKSKEGYKSSSHSFPIKGQQSHVYSSYTKFARQGVAQVFLGL
jgi:hypothetical protein